MQSWCFFHQRSYPQAQKGALKIAWGRGRVRVSDSALAAQPGSGGGTERQEPKGNEGVGSFLETKGTETGHLGLSEEGTGGLNFSN